MFLIIRCKALSYHITAELRELSAQYRAESVLDTPVKHLTSGSYDADAETPERPYLHKRFLHSVSPADTFHSLKLPLVSHQRHDARTRHGLSLAHGRHGMHGGERNLLQTVYLKQTFHIDHEQPVTVGQSVNPPFLRSGKDEVIPHGGIHDAPGGVILMHKTRQSLVYIEMFLAYLEEDGNILLCDDMPLTEYRPLAFSGHNPRNVMAQHGPHGILNANCLQAGSGCGYGRTRHERSRQKSRIRFYLKPCL